MFNRLELVHQVAEGDIRSFTVVYDHGIHHEELVFAKAQYKTWRKSTYMDKKVVSAGEDIEQEDAVSAISEYVMKINNGDEGYDLLIEYSDEYRKRMGGGATKDEIEAVVGQMFQQLQNHIDEHFDNAIQQIISAVLNK